MKHLKEVYKLSRYHYHTHRRHENLSMTEQCSEAEVLNVVKLLKVPEEAGASLKLAGRKVQALGVMAVKRFETNEKAG